MNSVARLAALAPLCLVVLAACSSRSGEVSLSPSAGEPPLAAVVPQPSPSSAQAVHRPVRPIPEVIQRHRPFRLADALAPTAVAATPQDAADAPGRLSVAADAAGSLTADVDGIRRTMESYLRAFNRHDAAALAAHWSEAGQSVDIDTGETTRGRDAVRDVFAALFSQDAAASIDIDVESIRPVRDDVAVIDGVSRLSFSDGPESSSRFSAVLVREAGGWVLDSVRESAAPVDSAPSPRGTTTRPLDELGWLVGSWEDVGDGVTASTQCFWARNRAFLIRSHAVSVDAVNERLPAPGDDRIPGLLPVTPAGSREITEIIGWDPDEHRIRSWLFTSDGRFAEAEWSRDGESWHVTIARPHHGAASAGFNAAPAAESVYTITRAGGDEMACRLSGEAHADLLPPGCDFLRTARVEAAVPVVETP